MHKAAPTNMNSLSRAIINTEVYFPLWTSTLHMLFAPAWPTWEQAGGHPMLLVRISLGGIPSPLGTGSCLIPHSAEGSSSLGWSFSFCTFSAVWSSALPHPPQCPALFPTQLLMLLPCLLPLLMLLFWISQLSRLTSCPSADAFSSVTTMTSTLQFDWMVPQFVVQISVLHSAALFQVFQASMTAPSHWHHLHHAHETPDRDNFT